jgi:CTP:molybdopterin cytidylyltransferase MocA
VLAAGEGKRFGGPKAPYEFEGERLVDRAVRTLREGGCEPVIVVLGAWLGHVLDAEMVINVDWSTGMGSSLRVGLEALALTNADRAIVTLVDLPGLTGNAVTRIAGATTSLAAATYDGVRGHPVLLGREHWQPLAESVTGDQGARDYLTNHDIELIEVADIASGDDLDVRP